MALTLLVNIPYFSYQQKDEIGSEKAPIMTRTLRDDLMDCLAEELNSDETRKLIDKRIEDMSNDLSIRLEGAVKDDLAVNLAWWVAQMAGDTIKAILEGNEEEMRRCLSCDKRSEDGTYGVYTGRSDGSYWGRKKDDHEWHSVIHGKLFEHGAVALRKKIVDAHRDMLASERIFDLEDQVKSLVAQVNKVTAEKEAMWERVRASA